MAKTLYLFTGKFPYAQYVECFLEDEIIYLSKKFNKVVIVPTRGDSYKREVPQNCMVTNPVFPSKLVFLLKGLYNKRTFIKLLQDFFYNQVYKNRKKFVVWLKAGLVINNLLNSKIINKLESLLDDSDVCYYYWGKWSNLLSLFFIQNCHHVSRFHGAWDLWEEEFDNYAPLRSELVKKLDLAVFISQIGQKYFKNKYPDAHTSFNPLGSVDYGLKHKKNDEIIRIVSCSTVYPLKRVNLIFESVLHFAKKSKSNKIEWTHIGGGPDFDKIKKIAESNSLENLKIILVGNINHAKVIEKYKNNCYDVFVNLSTNEGVPVSIMEATSFNIPIVATDVGGTPEIVSNDSGILVSPNPTSEEVSEAIEKILTKQLVPREFWLSNYCAEKNYTIFSDVLYSISN